MSGIFYMDGVFVEQADAQLPVTDLAIIRGYGVFDFTRTYNRQPFHLEAHVARLFRSAELVMIDMLWTQAEICDIIRGAIAKNPDYADCNVRFMVTAGDTIDSLNPAGKPRLIVMVNPVTILPQAFRDHGIKIITTPDTRAYPGVKSINYLPALLALKQAQAQDAIDALFIDDNQFVREGTTNNLFAILGNTLVTPPLENVLGGITRAVVLDLASKIDGIRIEERYISLEEVYNADEVFMTSSIKEVMPVRQINDRIIGDGRPGEATQLLYTLFTAYVREVSS